MTTSLAVVHGGSGRGFYVVARDRRKPRRLTCVAGPFTSEAQARHHIRRLRLATLLPL